MSNPSYPDFPTESFHAWDEVRFRGKDNSVEHEGRLYVIEDTKLETCTDQNGAWWLELKVPLRKYTASGPIGACHAFHHLRHEGIGAIVFVDSDPYEIQNVEIGSKNNPDGSSWFGMTVKIIRLPK